MDGAQVICFKVVEKCKSPIDYNINIIMDELHGGWIARVISYKVKFSPHLKVALGEHEKSHSHQMPKISAKLLLLVYLPAEGDGAELERKLTRSRPTL